MLSFFPPDVLDEILNLIEPFSEGFPSYSCIDISSRKAKELSSLADLDSILKVTGISMWNVQLPLEPVGGFQSKL